MYSFQFSYEFNFNDCAGYGGDARGDGGDHHQSGRGALGLQVDRSVRVPGGSLIVLHLPQYYFLTQGATTDRDDTTGDDEEGEEEGGGEKGGMGEEVQGRVRKGGVMPLVQRHHVVLRRHAVVARIMDGRS